MSYWSYVNGMIAVRPFGRTQSEKRYILETVLDHMPMVCGSEDGMHVNIIQKKSGSQLSSSTNEFGELTKRRHGEYGFCEPFDVDEEYIVVVDGAFRDRMFDETLKSFMNWLCRLSKRIMTKDVLVRIEADDRRNPYIISHTGYRHAYHEMFEIPSWSFNNKNGSSNWCEYLLWDSIDGTDYPKKLYEKYNGKIE